MTRLPRFLLVLLPQTLAAAPARGAVLQPASAGSGRVSDDTPTPTCRPEGAPLRHANFLAALVFLCATTLTFAQTVTWDPPSGSLARGQTSQLSLVFDDCGPSDDFQLPVVAGLQIGRPSQSSQTSIINFKMSKRVVLAYPVVPTATSGRIVIPAFDVDTDKGRLHVEAAAYEVGEATVGRSNVPIERVAGATLTAKPDSVWAGQVFDLDYSLLVSRRYNPANVGPLDWTPPGNLYIEPWGKFEMINAVVGGDNRVGVANHTRAYFKDPGTHPLPPTRQPIDLATGSSTSFGFFGDRPNLEQFLITGSVPTIEVKPLPTPAPADFLRAVGEFTFTSKIVPTTAAVGDPITWTLTLEGTGNWPDGLALPAREVSRDFRAFQPNTQRKIEDGTLFEGTLTEDIVLMPTKPGTYTLGPVSYSYFDPVAGKYKTVRSEAVKVTITPPAPASTATGTTNSGPAPVFQFTPDTSAPAATSDSDPVVKSPAPTLPGHLPMMPLSGSATARTPWERLAPITLLAPLPALLVLWLGLGWRRARLTDSRRAQRIALAELPDAIAAVRDATANDTRAIALRNWQQLAAQAWAADHAAPSLTTFTAAVRTELVGAAPEAVSAWSRLWQEAEAHRFGRSTALPADWADRALLAQRTARLRPRPIFGFLKPSNLLPLVLVAFCFVAAPRAQATSAAEDAYGRAEFPLAEQAWRASLKVSPDNWILRHNLGLAEAQQDRWSEAVAQWGTAFLAAPRNPSVRWHLALGLERAEFTQPEFAALSNGRGLCALARLASPAEWQQIVVTGSVLIGLALGFLLLARHFPARRILPWLAAAAALTGVLALATGFASLREYGPLAHPDAALVWQATELRSVPTEAGEQKTEPLAAGTIARVTKSFFGWDELLFPNGQTGWIRHETLQPLYPRKTETKPQS